jgi:hypothetical protein
VTILSVLADAFVGLADFALRLMMKERVVTKYERKLVLVGMMQLVLF